MALVNLKGMLNHARKNKYGVGAFDVSNLDMAIAVTQVAEEKKSPVILMGLTLDLQGDRLEYWLDNMKKIAKNTSVPVALHLDHATDIDCIIVRKPLVRPGVPKSFSDESLKV
ncbi:class II fructose-bisphosphate aldolase [Megasphaera cerevisiae]|uniref:class II fructose-bisphosphate aldolase n=1 Tax=Megasphaera cerevisiae TaxID=39029 RepID=UPI0009FB5BC5|nr:class II fructose-bisphosphate aldolase [Megasphaera cerevisiae]